MRTYYVYLHCNGSYIYSTDARLQRRYRLMLLPYVINCRMKEKLPC